MHNPWVGLREGVDPVHLAKLLSRAHDLVLSGDRTPDGLRSLVVSSWQRCQQAGVSAEDHDAPVQRSQDEVTARWAEHPLHRHMGLIEQTLLEFTYDARHIVVVSDADGCLLWSGGHPKVLKASETIGFVPGRSWGEHATGTNGVGTALALGHPVQIFSAEHYNRQVHAWSCSGAPVHDPATNEVLGVIDVSSGIRAAHPHSLAVVAATARMVESALARDLAERNEALRSRFFEHLEGHRWRASALIDDHGHILFAHPRGWLAGPLLKVGEHDWIAPGSNTVLRAERVRDGAAIVSPADGDSDEALPSMYIRALGRECAQVELSGAKFELSPRRSELLVLLSLAADGLGADELARELYGDEDRRLTVRAEVSRLRAQLGGLLATKPYRLLGDVDADYLELARALDEGRSIDGLPLGPLLAHATSPTLCQARDRLDRGVMRTGSITAT